MMKIFYLILFSPFLALLLGCNTALSTLSTFSPASTFTPTLSPSLPFSASRSLPTVESRPVITPLESQTFISATIAYGEVKEGQSTDALPAEWTFNAQAGERVNIVINSAFDSYLEIFAPNGEFMTSNDDTENSLNAALFDVQITQSGLHTIRVHSYGGATGSYAIALTGGHPTDGGGELTSSGTRTIILTERGIKWRYEGQRGTYLTVGVQAENNIDSHLTLYGPNGIKLLSDDDSGTDLNAEIFEYQLPEDGTYTILGRTLTGAGLATLELTATAQPSGGGLLTIGETREATLPPSRSHQWTFEGEVGQIINLSMRSIDFDTFLELRDADGTILTENDDVEGGTDSAIELFSLPAEGTYTVVARGLSEIDSGDYEITLKLAKILPGGGPLLFDQPTQAALIPGQSDTWVFEAEANSFVTVNVRSSLLDSYIELYGPDDTLLIEDDDSGGDLNAALLDFPIPEAGEYRLIVRPAQEGSKTGGVYEITLTTTENLTTSGELVPGQVVESYLNAGEQHTWTFEAKLDDYLTVRMESDTLDTYLALYNETGTLLNLNDDFFGKQAVISNYIIPADGQYRIVARAYSGEEVGDYTISLDITEEEVSPTPGSDESGPTETE